MNAHDWFGDNGLGDWDKVLNSEGSGSTMNNRGRVLLFTVGAILGALLIIAIKVIL